MTESPAGGDDMLGRLAVPLALALCVACSGSGDQAESTPPTTPDPTSSGSVDIATSEAENLSSQVSAALGTAMDCEATDVPAIWRCDVASPEAEGESPVVTAITAGPDTWAFMRTGTAAPLWLTPGEGQLGDGPGGGLTCGQLIQAVSADWAPSPEQTVFAVLYYYADRDGLPQAPDAACSEELSPSALESVLDGGLVE